MKHCFKLADLTATQKLAQNIASVIVPNFVIILNGNLGAGKTTLVREILQTLGVSGRIKSPSFTLVEPYAIKRFNHAYHFDLYRFEDADEWFYAGFDEYFNPQAQNIFFIEWAQKALQLIPWQDWQIDIDLIDLHSRSIVINALSGNGIQCLKQLIKNVEI